MNEVRAVRVATEARDIAIECRNAFAKGSSEFAVGDAAVIELNRLLARTQAAADQPQPDDRNRDGSLRCNLCWSDPCKCGQPTGTRRDEDAKLRFTPMEQPMRDALIAHLEGYLLGYTERGATREGAALNYVREFPARLHLLILALLEKKA